MFAGGSSGSAKLQNSSPISGTTNEVQKEVIESVEIEVRTESSVYPAHEPTFRAS